MTNEEFETDDESFYIVYDWMTKRLELKGLDLNVYAIIYNFTKNTEHHCYSGSLKYLSERTNASKQGLLNSLENLQNKGLLKKFEVFKGGSKFCNYSTIKYPNKDENSTQSTSKENRQVVKKVDRGGQETLPTQSTNFTESVKKVDLIIKREQREKENTKEREDFACAFIPGENFNYGKVIFQKWSNYGFLNNGEIYFLNKFAQNQKMLSGLHSDDVLAAIDNYKKVRDSGSWYSKKHNLTFDSFCKNIDGFLPGNFDISRYVDSKDLEAIKKREEETVIKYHDKNCSLCGARMLEWSDLKQNFYCHSCNKTLMFEDIYGVI